MHDDNSLFAGDQPTTETPDGRPHRHRVAVVCGLALVLAVVGTVVGLVVSNVSTSGGGSAKERVLRALSATVSSGSYDFQYELSSTAPTLSPPASGVSTTNCVAPSDASTGASTQPSNTELPCGGGSSAGVPTGPVVTTGRGTTDSSPFAMVVSAHTTSATAGDATLRVDSHTIYIAGGLDPTLSAPRGLEGQSEAPVSSILEIEEASIGTLEGAWATLDLTDPGGYLNLAQNSITSASETGSGTVDGVAVTQYQVTLAPSSHAEEINLSREESAAIAAADHVLVTGGLTGTTVDLSIDQAGYIRHLVAVSGFADGATVTTTVTLNNVGCAGTVLMPGQASGHSSASCAGGGASSATGATC